MPLFIITPDNQVYAENKIVASFLDISPTILYSAGIPFTINSFGEDLIKHEKIQNKIPYKGSEYSREELFSKIGK